MGPSLNSEETIREYLLGRVSDETTLEGLEELLFTDEDFCSQVALAEDVLINDYVVGRLNDADAESFQATLRVNPERRFNLELTQRLREKALARNLATTKDKKSWFSSLTFFRQPMYAGGFAVLLIAVVAALVIYFSGRNHLDELAELRSVYKQARPTETRISAFDYAPLTQLRGAPDPGYTSKLRRIENNLLEATEKSPGAETQHALGVFYLTQRNYRDAIRQFEMALRFADTNAKIHNDLGAAYFELSKTESKEKKLENLQQSVEEFTKATELDGNSLEALFNKSLALQELAPREAKESWTRYLQKDSSSPWADEARKHLTTLESEQSLFKSDEQVLSDFLTAYRTDDKARAEKIHNETKGLLKGVTVPLQLSRRYLLAKQSGNEAEARESIEALAHLGNFDQTHNGDSFFFELATFYSHVRPETTARLLQAQVLFANGQRFLSTYKFAEAISEFEQSRDLFTQLGDTCEAAIAETWAAQCLRDVGRLAEGRRRLWSLIETGERRSFKILLPPAYFWLAMSDFRQSGLSEANKHLKTALRQAEATDNVFEVHHAQDALVANYSKLGELQTALSYASRMFSERGLYYQNPRQDWREKGTLADLSIKLRFFATSLSLARERLRMLQENPDDLSRVKGTLRQIVQAAGAKGDFDEALKHANESMRLVRTEEGGPANMIATAEIHLLLANLKSRKKDCSAALNDYDQALELYRRLPEITENLYEIHKGKLFCFERLDRQEDFASELMTVLKLSEEYRATIREDTSRQAFFANEQIVFDTAATNAVKAGDKRKAFEFVEASKARSLLDFVESGKSIAEVEKGFGAVARPLLLPEIQARLPENVQLVQYAVLPDKLLLWIISKTHFDMGEKHIAAIDLAKKIDAYQAAILAKETPAELRDAGRELYDLLIPQGLSDGQELCLVPDKSLHELAFATLVSPRGNYLLEDHALFYSPSASVSVLASDNARRKEQLKNESILTIGNPDFEREETQELANLPAAETEAKTIAGDYMRSTHLIGAEATKARFLASFVGVQVVHFAGHFVANRLSPANSKLLFAQGELRASELSTYKLPQSKLVVLSACETGFERYSKSEGAIGIARTLLAMGAPLVVASQWQVDSEPTKDLMIAFHRNRAHEGMSSAKSLRRAQLEVLSNEKTQAPFYWAAFSLFGGYANY